MALINLLPWRDELRQQRNRDFYTALVAFLIIGLILSGLAWMYFSNRLENQQAANELVKQRTSQVDSQLGSLKDLQARRDAIVERTKIISELQSKRPVSVRLLDEMSRLIPPNLYLTKFERKEDKFYVEGRAESPNTVSELLRNIDASPWFRNAFMTSYTGNNPTATATGTPDSTTPAAVSGSPVQNATSGVLPRPEANYGSFSITMDLDEPSVEQLTTNAPALVPPGVATVPGQTTTVTTSQTTVTTPPVVVPPSIVPAPVVTPPPAPAVKTQTTTTKTTTQQPTIVLPPANSINAPVANPAIKQQTTVTTTQTPGA